MTVSPLSTPLIHAAEYSIMQVLDQAIHSFPEQSVLVVTSKILSLCQGRVVNYDQTTKQKLIQQESEYFLVPGLNPYDISLTITNNVLIPNAGIDSSNGDGKFVLWPENPSQAATEIRTYLMKRFTLKSCGVIITDSTTTPLRWGTTGVALGYAGFMPLHSYIGQEDLFKRTIEVSKASILDGLAAAAVLTMGEGSEQTPLAVIEDIPFVTFVASNKAGELPAIPMQEDLYGPLLQSTPWKKGDRTPNESTA